MQKEAAWVNFENIQHCQFYYFQFVPVLIGSLTTYVNIEHNSKHLPGFCVLQSLCNIPVAMAAASISQLAAWLLSEASSVVTYFKDSGRVNRATATEMIDSRSNLGRVKQKTIKIDIQMQLPSLTFSN